MVIYGVTSFGMTLHLHYCCGKLDKVSLSSKISAACKFETTGDNKTIHNKSCCDNKEFELKIKADQETSSQQILSFELQPVNTPGYSSRLLYLQKAPVNFLYTGPPFLSSIPLFITNCVYRI